MESKEPIGLINAVTTPFGADNRIDEGAFTEHLTWLEEKGIRHILVAGTTGEFFSLTIGERLQLLKLATHHFKGGIMFHAGAGSLVDTVALTYFGTEEGAHSIAALPPYYLASVPEDGLIAYFQALSGSTHLPFLLYNFPAHTQLDITAKMLKEIPHFGVKDSSANLELIGATKNYFIGSDTNVLDSHEAGGKGFISARSNAEPRLYSQLDDALRANNMDAARPLHKTVLEVCASLSGQSQIQLVKKRIATHLPGYPTHVRLPLI